MWRLLIYHFVAFCAFMMLFPLTTSNGTCMSPAGNVVPQLWVTLACYITRGATPWTAYKLLGLQTWEGRKRYLVTRDNREYKLPISIPICSLRLQGVEPAITRCNMCRLTPSLNHNLVKLRLGLNSSGFLVGNSFVNPSAT